MSEEFYGDEEESELECPECGEELDEDEICQNAECPCFGEEPVSSMSDAELRRHERQQMGIT